MGNTLISIVVPTIPGRTERINAMLSRLSIAISRQPDIPTEIIIVDGGSTDELENICKKYGEYLDIKYVYLPIGKFVNAAYPRNVGFRLAKGEIISMLDADYWPSEDLISGIFEPYADGSRDVINNGYVIDTSKGKVKPDQEVADALLHMNNWDKQILGIYDYLELKRPHEEDNHIWLWAAPKKNILQMGGYDEKFVCGYSREDDSFFYRLMKSGLKRHKKSRSEFCCLHLWHPASQRNDSLNALNRKYYEQMGGNNPTPIERNTDHEWGKFIKDSFTYINGNVRDAIETEEWISDNTAAPAYEDVWEDIEDLKTSYGYKG